LITIRKSEDRGRTKLDWLDSRHTFSFGDYYDPRFMGFRHLRVINEDVVQPGGGFPTHPHRDMEIITYVLEGALEHKDSMGNGSVIRWGEVQRMSAGTGVTHSEYNPSRSEPVHLLQIWILPERAGGPPGYEQRAFSLEEARGKLLLVAARDARVGALTIQQDAELSIALLEQGGKLTHQLRQGRYVWLQLARGGISVNGVALKAGDGAAISDEPELKIEANSAAELLMFDLA
jgi:redox-sensitive bicupin YhaK (pirin superfamily)